MPLITDVSLAQFIGVVSKSSVRLLIYVGTESEFLSELAQCHTSHAPQLQGFDWESFQIHFSPLEGIGAFVSRAVLRSSSPVIAIWGMWKKTATQDHAEARAQTSSTAPTNIPASMFMKYLMLLGTSTGTPHIFFGETSGFDVTVGSESISGTSFLTKWEGLTESDNHQDWQDSPS